MLSALAGQYKAVVAFMRSVVEESFSNDSKKMSLQGRPATSSRAERDGMGRRETSEHRSDFQGEAPGALVQAYREAAEADHSDNLRRRSFVI